MLRIIMLVPLSENVSLTTITLSLVSCISKKISKNFFKSCFYFSLIDHSIDKTRLMINKYFLNKIDMLDNINFLNQRFSSDQYHILLEQVIEQCYSKKNVNGFILIPGINNKYHIDSEKINYEVAQNINAEVILLEHINDFSSKCLSIIENKIKIFLQLNPYKNILGMIFNNINSPFIQKKYNFIEKLNILYDFKTHQNICSINKDDFLKNYSFPILAYIPWNKNLFKLSVIEICNFLNANAIHIKKTINYIVKKIVIFDENYTDAIKNNYNYALCLICVSRLKIFINQILNRLHLHKISGIILTGKAKFTKSIINLINCLKDKKIPVFFMSQSTITILSKLNKFNFNISFCNKLHIYKIFKYIEDYLNNIDFHCFQKRMFNTNKKYLPQVFCHYLKILSKQKIKRIILPEAYEPRILQAATIVHNLGMAECVLLGSSKKIYQVAKDKGINLNTNIKILEPSLIRNHYISKLLELRKNKGITEFSAQQQLQDNTVLATLILESNKVDGLVSGSINTTANTIRPALQIIKTNPIYSLVSSIFFMLFPQEVLIYGDCAINIDPTSEELAEIAIQSANSAKKFGIKPRIAMLSYSSGHSGKGLQVDKVRCATNIVKSKQPNLIIEGPIQYDAAISKSISQLKTPNSLLSGSANVFIFPDLNSGNITYKAIQRSLGLTCIGPMLQGLRKPVNDLSRGASIEDIIYTIVLTAIQS